MFIVDLCEMSLTKADKEVIGCLRALPLPQYNLKSSKPNVNRQSVKAFLGPYKTFFYFQLLEFQAFTFYCGF